MLNIYDKNRVYYDNFNFYFDRNKNLNVIFSFNFSGLIKDLLGIDDKDFLNLIKNDYDIKIYLTRKEEYGDFSQPFDYIFNINLFSGINSYLCKKSVANLRGKYDIFVRITYNNEADKYIDFVLKKDLSLPERNKFSSLKIINEEK